MSDAGPVAALLQAAQAMPLLELTAVVLGVAYLLLAVRESLWCWYAAFISTAIFLLLFWDVGLLMESALQVYYLAMAVYGWWQWQQGSGAQAELAISRWGVRQHLISLAAILLASAASGALLQHYTGAALPYLDSFTTWGSILTTWMVARKILENWLYWLVIDSVSIYLYLDRALYLTALLFALYLVIVLFGYRKWLQHYRAISA
jgi:nicotinamide mononucleotide transporter